MPDISESEQETLDFLKRRALQEGWHVSTHSSRYFTCERDLDMVSVAFYDHRLHASHFTRIDGDTAVSDQALTWIEGSR